MLSKRPVAELSICTDEETISVTFGMERCEIDGFEQNLVKWREISLMRP
jgi:hypothetical protein